MHLGQLSAIVACFMVSPADNGLPVRHNDVMTIDYARSEFRAAWTSHPVLGDLSFDAFTRRPGNPIVRGAAPLDWPVNGFLFIDPPSGHWFIYAGRYRRGYFADRPLPAADHMLCTILRSVDQGATWTEIGPAFGDLDTFVFEGDDVPAGLAPDVSVVFADGRYHLVYDWLSSSFEINQLGRGWTRECDSGVGYAWSERPEGPFHRARRPLLRNSSPPAHCYAEKYRRFYASTLIRRPRDWVLLSLVDSPDVVRWGLAAMRADQPEGPYEDPVIVLHLEDERPLPALQEYFPAFVHEGWIYAPATSVAANRSFQTLHRAPLDRALDPTAWTLLESGSLWHNEPIEHETAGIWGQTFSAAIDAHGTLHALFPSKDGGGFGTLNLAQRPWARLWNESGAVLSAPNAPALVLLRQNYEAFRLTARVRWRGALTLRWACQAPLGPDRLNADAQPHPLCDSSYYGLQLTATHWSLLTVDEHSSVHVVAGGAWSAPAGDCAIEVETLASGSGRITLNHSEIWTGELAPAAGALALHLDTGGWARLEEFRVTGEVLAGVQTWLAQEALLGAGERTGDWRIENASHFRHGVGAVHRGAGSTAKWNFVGGAVALWSPRDPEFGEIEVLLDGTVCARLNLHSDATEASSVVWRSRPLADTRHTLRLRAATGSLVVDCCEVTSRPLRPPP